MVISDSMTEDRLLQNIINDSNTEYWEYKDGSNYWSSAFLKKLGYNESDIDVNISFFLNKLIGDDYREEFRDNFFSYIKHHTHFEQNIQILRKDGKLKEFFCYTNEKEAIAQKDDSKILFFKEKKFRTNEKVKKSNFYYREFAKMTNTGSWFIDFIKQKSYWDQQTRKILEYPEDYLPSLKKAYKYYAEEHIKLASNCFIQCSMEGIPFDTEIIMLTANKRKFWVRAIGKPVYDNERNIIGIRGIFQDIDDDKSKILTLQKTSDIIASQNSRLFNFAHIVSHNLRSHSSNLTLITDFIEDVDSIEEKLEMLGNIKDISESLNSTIEHLNEIVTIQTKTNHKKVKVSFSETLDRVIKSISRIIHESDTKFNIDFSQLSHLNYLPAYLESILLNLVTNAIKYKHKQRSPEIAIKTYVSEGKKYLEVSDNGMGIDMQKFGNKLFGMYKTFHYNKDAVGIGLFITKNQVESLNGHISVDSDVDIGSTFKIQF